jgi:hypothetical protein
VYRPNSDHALQPFRKTPFRPTPAARLVVQRSLTTEEERRRRAERFGVDARAEAQAAEQARQEQVRQVRAAMGRRTQVELGGSPYARTGAYKHVHATIAGSAEDLINILWSEATHGAITNVHDRGDYWEVTWSAAGAERFYLERERSARNITIMGNVKKDGSAVAFFHFGPVA